MQLKSRLTESWIAISSVSVNYLELCHFRLVYIRLNTNGHGKRSAIMEDKCNHGRQVVRDKLDRANWFMRKFQVKHLLIK